MRKGLGFLLLGRNGKLSPTTERVPRSRSWIPWAVERSQESELRGREHRRIGPERPLSPTYFHPNSGPTTDEYSSEDPLGRLSTLSQEGESDVQFLDQGNEETEEGHPPRHPFRPFQFPETS